MSPFAEPSNPPLIKTRLSAPQRRSSLVARPRLLRLLAEGSTRALTLVCAPPGYGKTTLIADWIASLPKAAPGKNPAVGWLSLDAGDNDPALFLSYLVAAFENANSQLSGEASAMLKSFPPPPFQTVLSVLINCLDALAGSTCLVLDDYQFITNPAIHQGLAYFLEHLPPAVHLVIATRSDPPLPLARLRARNQLVEIRTDDIRFTPAEAADFLNQVMRLPLSPTDIAALETRTEGWAAGLQMAAVAMQGLARQAPAPEQANLSQFIERFSGSHRYILDYMAEETINHLPEAVQRFLSWTALMDRFCAPLCDALMGDPAIDSAEMLAYLDRANLFLVALDSDGAAAGRAAGEQTWYRYHLLFADLLRARLKQSQPALIPQLHLRAADWYEQNGFVVEAIQHSLSAGDCERAAALIERRGPARWSQSDTSILMLAAHLPREVLLAHPRLGIYWAWVLVASGQAASAVPLLRALKTAVGAQNQNPAARWMDACIDLFLLYTASPVTGGPQTPLPDFQVLSAIPEEDIGLHNIADFVYAMLLGRRGEQDRPAEILMDCIERDAAARGTTAIPMGVPFLARMRLMQCRLHEAASLCRKYLKPVTKRGPKFFYNAGSLNIILGEVLREWNDLEAAEAEIREGIKVNEPWHLIAADSLGYTALARVQEARGDLPGALASLHHLEAMFEDRTRPVDWEGELRALEIRLWIATGELPRAVDWADHLPKQQLVAPLQETEQLTVVRVRLAEKNYAEAQRLLEAMDQLPGIEKRANRKIKMDLLLACALAGQNQLPQALRLLDACLAMAEPEGLTRVFLDIGEPMQDLLRRYLGEQAPGRRAYAQKLLAQFPAFAPAPAPLKPQPPLPEPLTAREMEVLRLMDAGLSNRQIAANLFLSEGTVKFYVHSILEKLEVHSRTAALARAKILGFI